MYERITITEKFDEFVGFCIQHGGTLKNHMQYMQMYQEIRKDIEDMEIKTEWKVKDYASIIQSETLPT
jgi:hypothetical protein